MIKVLIPTYYYYYYYMGDNGSYEPQDDYLSVSECEMDSNLIEVTTKDDNVVVLSIHNIKKVLKVFKGVEDAQTN